MDRQDFLVSSTRNKGNRLEAWWAQKLHEADGVDPILAPIQTPTGRLGATYRLQVDVASVNCKSECKNREDLSARLWTWLDQVRDTPLRKLPVLVLSRNRKRPLVVLDAHDFLDLIRRAHGNVPQ